MRLLDQGILSTIHRVPVEILDATNVEAWLDAVARAGAMLLEKPSNPLMRLIDIEGTVARACLRRPGDHGHSVAGCDKDASKVAALRFGEVKVGTHGEQHVFEAQVCLNAIDPKVVRVEPYAAGVIHETH